LFSRSYGLICAANFSFWAGMYCLFGAFPLYVVRIGGSPSEAGLVTGAIPLTSFVTQLLMARSIARWPRVGVLAAAPMVLPLGVVAAQLAPSSRMLVVASVILGTGYTTFQTAATTLDADVTPPARRGEALGVYGSFTTVSLAVGPTLGIALLQWAGPVATWVAAAGLGLAASLLALGVRAGDVPPSVAEPAVGAASRPGLDPIIFFCMFVNAGLTFTHGTLVAFLPLYARSIGMGNPGLFYTVFAVGAIVVRAVAGRLSDTFGRVQVVVPATIVLTAALWALAAGPSIPALLAIAVLYAFGYGSLHPTNLAFAVDRAPATARPTALALVNSGFALGMGTGALAMGAVLALTSFPVTFALTGLVPLATTGAFVARYATHRPPRLS